MYNDQTYFEKSPNILCSHRKSFKVCLAISAQKVKFSIKGLFSKCDQIGSFLRIWSHLLKKSLMKNFIFCAVPVKILGEASSIKSFGVWEGDAVSLLTQIGLATKPPRKLFWFNYIYSSSVTISTPFKLQGDS